MLYAVRACESNYGGMHGVVDYRVDEYDSLEEAEMDGRNMSEELIYSYGMEPEPEGEDWEDDDECANAWAELIEYMVWKIPDTKGKTKEELEEIFSNYEDEFIKEYCVCL